MAQPGLDPTVQAALRDKAVQFVAELTLLDARSPAFAQKVTQITTMGQAELRRAATLASRQLDRPALAQGTQGRLFALLARLREAMVRLDPAALGAGGAGGRRRLFRARVPEPADDRYFEQYSHAQAELDSITRGLVAGQDELRKDNAEIETERANQAALGAKLSEYLGLAAELDAALGRAVADLQAAGRNDAADAVRSEALLPIRQRQQELATQQAVSLQGALALELVHANNVELIRGVDRAQQATIAALRIAVAVSEALSGRRLVLDRIAALNEHARSAASGTPADLDALRQAFAAVFTSMDALDAAEPGAAPRSVAR